MRIPNIGFIHLDAELGKSEYCERIVLMYSEEQSLLRKPIGGLRHAIGPLRRTEGGAFDEVMRQMCKSLCRYRLARSRTLGSQPKDTGSNPVSGT